MEQQYVILHKNDPLSWALMPHALKRIKAFCTRLGTDHDPEALAALVQQHFISDNPLMHLMVGVRKGAGVFCHALAGIDEAIGGKRCLTILHFDTDEPFQDREEINSVWQEFKDWGRRNGAEFVQVITSDEAHARMLSRFYGLDKHRILMRAPLED